MDNSFIAKELIAVAEILADRDEDGLDLDKAIDESKQEIKALENEFGKLLGAHKVALGKIMEQARLVNKELLPYSAKLSKRLDKLEGKLEWQCGGQGSDYRGQVKRVRQVLGGAFRLSDEIDSIQDKIGDILS